MNASALAGLAVMVGSEAATLMGIEPFASWNTPIAWTGFILFADGIVWRARGSSWIRSSPRELAFLAVAFALECFTMYVFARTACVSTVSGFGPFVGPGRPIALSSDSSADTPLEETPAGTFAEIGTRPDHRY